MKVLTRCLVAVGIFALPATVFCQEKASAYRDWDLGMWIAFSTGEENTNSFAEAQIMSAGPFIGRAIKRPAGGGWWKGNMEYGFSASPLFLQVRPQHLYGVAFEPIIVRWNSTYDLGHMMPYIELAGGGVRTNRNLPVGNTSDFNFTVSGGGGFYLHSRTGQAWDLGAQWMHISNANLGIQNPEFNGIRICLTYHWYR